MNERPRAFDFPGRGRFLAAAAAAGLAVWLALGWAALSIWRLAP